MTTAQTPGRLTVDASRPGPVLNSEMYGAFFEDLNHAADGGLYAELVQNRSFEFDPIDNEDYHSLTAWSLVTRGGGIASIHTAQENPLSPNNPTYVVLDVTTPGTGAGLMNHGFNTGIAVQEGERYHFTFYCRCDDNGSRPVQIRLESQTEDLFAEALITVESGDWVQYKAVLTSSGTDTAARLVLLTTGTGRLHMDMVSLFPEKTFNERPGGLRKDIARLIAELKPGFMRFPGGCLVHDGSLDPEARNSMYRWKNTIGDVASRPSRRNNWSYNQSMGLGYYEYFQFCEDIGAAPLPVLPAAYNPHHGLEEPLDQLGPWIDDALDLIEFANGTTDTVWGAKRAELGHPEPFGLQYIAIGNEEVRQGYFDRYPYFQNAIREKHPEIKVICSSGPQPQGEDYETGWNYSRQFQADLVDEHYYALPSWFLSNWHRYDDFDRSGPKVFVGEYASWGNKFYNALAEAAYMTGLERNADVVKLTCYAPMLANIDYVNWRPNLIWFNNHQAFGSVNYYVQQMFSLNKGDVVLHSELALNPPSNEHTATEESIRGRIGVGTFRTSVKYMDFTISDNLAGTTYFSDSFQNHSLLWKIREGDWIAAAGGYVQSSTDLADCRSTVSADVSNHYTISVKGVKLDGEEGLRIIFGEQDRNNYYVWNYGGWINRLSTLRKCVDGTEATIIEIDQVSVETGREYALKVEVSGRHIRCYVDDVLIHDLIDPVSTIEPLYYTASKDYASGDIIIKAVNAQEDELEVQLTLEGVDRIGEIGKVIELSADSLDAENSFAAPQRVVPVSKDLTGLGKSFTYRFPGHSVTMLRLKTD
ncbi:alpha-L-arabinofuranosidase C-terminal domain-containing protein [Paenibacillus borealis]|uniref:alpha-L-arabinofuranosidase C-terminal domain-containing protein n=1 Tax=Paenibacillus borealis TaxID=160799 RepID=UPI000695017D|nr:alpha-L-arabinofuranosidase C-terminal domain-containing protein [Paenibacillus borealis]